MNKQITLFGLTIILCLISFRCDHFDTEPTIQFSPNEAQKQARIFIDNHFIKMVDGEYHITINKTEAKEYGISETIYDQVEHNIQVGNELIRSTIASSLSRSGKNFKITITDCTYDTIPEYETTIQSIETLSNSEIPTRPMPSGSITTSDQNYGYGSCFAPSEMKQIRANCFSYVALAATHLVSTKTLGYERIETRVSVVPLAFSNIDCYISYKTSDSNGGRCAWKGEM